MRYKVKDIGEEGLEVRVPVTAEWLAEECPDLQGAPAPGGLTLTGKLSEVGDSFLLRGQMKGGVLVPCARCLEPAEVPIEAEVAVTYVEGAEEAGDEDEGDAGGDVITFDGEEIDLASEVRDEILLAIPIGPICRADCAGICPVCGGNRNNQPCDCEEQQRRAASQFSALKDLKV